MKEITFREVNDFQAIEIRLNNGNTVSGLYTPQSVTIHLLPEGLYKYEVREENNEPFSSIETSVIENRNGTIITLNELPSNLEGVISFLEYTLLEKTDFETWLDHQMG